MGTSPLQEFARENQKAKIQNPKSKIKNPKSKISKFQISDSRSQELATAHLI
jgi:hypothetical protein